MYITINGQNREYSGAPTMGELLRSLGIRATAVAVERNLKILSRDEIESEPIAAGDSIEIIRLVGGG